MSHTSPTTKSGPWGLLAEFSTPEALIEAAKSAKAAGYRCYDTHSPFPIHGLDEHLPTGPTRLPWLVLAGGITGFLLGYGLQFWTSVIDYPLDIGGRPLHSAPAFIPVSFETTVLLASLTAAIGMLLRNGFPQPYHPVFTVEAFARASRDAFFLAVESRDPLFELGKTRQFLESLKAEGVYEVES